MASRHPHVADVHASDRGYATHSAERGVTTVGEREADMPIILGLFQDVAQAQAAVQALLANHSALQPANIGIISKRVDGQIGFWEIAEEYELRQLSTLGRVAGWLL